MKICVSSQGNDINSMVDPRFGRCPYFIIVDPDTMEPESFSNPSASAMGGAGIQAAQFVADKGVKEVLTGNVGPNAFMTLRAAGISVITGVSGTVAEAVDKYKKGGFKSTGGPNVDSKFGVK